MTKTTFLATVCAVTALGLGARAQPDHPAPQDTKPDYPLTTCVVSGKALDSMGGPVTIVHEGTEVKFCCQGCVGMFRRNPAPHLAKIKAAADAKAAEGAAQPAEDDHAKAVVPYPLKVCVVSGEDLGHAPVSMVHEGRQIKFCCQGCQAKFEENPAPFLKKLEAGTTEQAKPESPAQRHHH